MESKRVVHDFDFIGRILEILRILQEETDEHTTISQSEILRLMKKHDYPCSARTLADYLKVIMKELNPEDEDGYVDKRYTVSDYRIIPKGLEEKLHARDLGLVHEGSKKLQLRDLRYNQLFSFDEMNQIVEAILFVKNIDSAKKEALIQKLQTLSSVNYPKYSPFISETTGKISNSLTSVFEDSRIDEVVVRNNLELIRNAIKANNGSGKKIAFNFNGYDENKKLIPRKNRDGNDKVYIVSPYHVILYNGKYYLICAMDLNDNVAIYRIDLMSNITDKIKQIKFDNQKMTCEPRKPKRQLRDIPLEWNDESASAFQTEHLYMFYGEPCKIRLKIDRDRYTLLHDYFGNRYEFKNHIDEQWDEVEVKCVPKAMESWAMQCSDYVEVLGPEQLRKDIIEKCQRLLRGYNRSL
ncbi:WYL domain-containing protein [Faecalimonas sp.]